MKKVLVGFILGALIATIGMSYKEHRLASQWEDVAIRIDKMGEEGFTKMRDGAGLWRYIASDLRHSFPHIDTAEDIKKRKRDREISKITKEIYEERLMATPHKP